MRFHRLVLACLAVLGAAPLLSGCGFTPLYSSAGYDRVAGMNVSVGGDSRFDYLLQNAVRDFAGPGASPYRLTLDPQVIVAPVGISPTGEATRVELLAVVIYTLNGAGDPIRGVRRSKISFDQPSDPYALLAAQGQAEELLAEQLAEELVASIAVDLRRREAGL
jgi:LPS-assembly lipoprotein